MQWRIDEELVGVGEHTQTHNTTGCEGDTGEGFGGARHGAPMLMLALGSFVLGGRAVLFVAEGSLKVKVVLGVGACWELERGWSCSFVMLFVLVLSN